MQIANLAKKLEATGLTEKQAKVYVASLFLGAAPVQRIAEQAEVNRATTYVILDELMAMGIVSTAHEGKKNVYVPEPPEAIERYLDSIEKEVESRKTELKSVMKDLKEASRVEVGESPVVRFFKGPEAAKSVSAYLRRKAHKNEVVYSMADVDEVLRIFPDKITENAKLRSKKSIKSQVIYSGTIDLTNDAQSGRFTKRMEPKVKGDLNIYEDRATILSYAGENTTGVIIESKEIAAILRQLYELAWESKKL